MKKHDAKVLHTMRRRVIPKLLKVKASAMSSATLKAVVNKRVYLKNQLKLLTFWAP